MIENEGTKVRIQINGLFLVLSGKKVRFENVKILLDVTEEMEQENTETDRERETKIKRNQFTWLYVLEAEVFPKAINVSKYCLICMYFEIGFNF